MTRLPPRRKAEKSGDQDAEFWSRFDSSIDKTGECWIWQGRLSDKGYGVVWRHGRHQYAHRLSYERAKDETLGVRHALHRCDNPACVNPTHIFPGTQADNNRDMYAKGRARNLNGAAASAAILSEEDVRAIASDPRIAKIVAASYGVSKSTIHAIRRGKNWRHLGLGLTARRRLTSEQRAEILHSSKSVALLADEYGVSHLTIYRAKGKHYR